VKLCSTVKLCAGTDCVAIIISAQSSASAKAARRGLPSKIDAEDSGVVVMMVSLPTMRPLTVVTLTLELYTRTVADSQKNGDNCCYQAWLLKNSHAPELAEIRLRQDAV
jgi:hypothetical protein